MNGPPRLAGAEVAAALAADAVDASCPGYPHDISVWCDKAYLASGQPASHPAK